MSLLNSILIFSFLFVSQPEVKKDEGIEWLKFEEAIKKNKTEKKLVFVDLYTDWCGWCKRMDATTFKDKEVVAYMSENYLSVKFNAEQKEDIVFQGTTFKFVASGRNGYHQLAAAMLQGQMSYPSFAILDENGKMVTVIKGYQSKADLMATFKAIEDWKKTNKN